MTPLRIDIPDLSAQLPALYQLMGVEIGATFAESSSNLMHAMRSFARDPADTYDGASLALECQGFLAGIHPPLTDPSFFWKSWPEIRPVEGPTSPASNPLQLGFEHFLSGVRAGTFGTLGILNNDAKEHSNAFLEGARHLFPDGVRGEPGFIRSVARAWGRLADQAASGQGQRLLPHSHEMGIGCAEILNDHYRLGLASALPASRLDASLHVRDVPAILVAKGWIAGIVESLHRSPGEKTAESARILEFNRSSIILHAFNGGNLLYIPETVQSVIDPGGFLRSLDVSIGEIGQENPTTATLLRSRKNTVTSKLLHAGNLKITKKVLLELKGWTEN